MTRALSATLVISFAYALGLASNIARMRWEFGLDQSPATFVSTSGIGLFVFLGASSMITSVLVFLRTNDRPLLMQAVGHGALLALYASALVAGWLSVIPGH